MKTFAQTFCEQTGCAPEQYLRAALKLCFYPRSRAFHRFFALFMPEEEMELLRAAGSAETLDQLQELLREYRYELQMHGGFFRRRLKFRVSTDCLLKLFKEVMSGQPGALD